MTSHGCTTRPGPTSPGNAVLGRIDDTALTRESAAAIARELTAYGINLDLAPVVDVNSAPDNPVIGVRSFGADAAHVARHAVAAVEGLQSQGVAACAKHFPGHGDTVTDSHLALPRVDAPADVLEVRELEPFRAAVAAGVACVMTSHVVVTAIDPDRPSTFSPTMLGGVLRGRLGFDGVIVSDALDMAGASAETGIPEAAVRALGAGCDLLCTGSETTEEDYLDIVDTVVAAVESGRLSRTRESPTRRRGWHRLRRAFAPAAVGSGRLAGDVGLWSDDVVQQAFSVSDAAREWLALDAAPGGRAGGVRPQPRGRPGGLGARCRRPDDRRGRRARRRQGRGGRPVPRSRPPARGRSRIGFVHKDIR